jgi:ribosome biogenesis SPOUT family RNA methylase Rps3
LIVGTILISGPAPADELAPDDREAADVIVVADLLSSLPQEARAPRLTARMTPSARTLGNRRIEGMN